MVEVINQYAKTYSDPPERVRRAGRGLVICDDKMLLSYERNTDVYMSPGGGAEQGESIEECCVRELREETGYEVKILEPFVVINEYCFETLYESNYFVCEVTGESENSLTDIEVEHGLMPVWVDIERALEIFGAYASKREDIGSLYLREFTVLNKYLKIRQTAL
ncbi:MAG: NUDIX domain-containing protein [Clostridia bacterium]|nr:NUDIX domain-containing protein [Clostridia bacterium]